MEPLALDPKRAFAPLEPVSTRDRIVAVLKDAFFAGVLKPGDPIVERQLAREMKVGTPPVREALIALQEQGFVRRIANTATYVTKFTPEEVRQAYALRVELEMVAFQWAKPRVTPAILQDLEARVARLVEAGERNEARRFLELDLEFHQTCWAISGNRFLVETLRRHMTPLSVFVVLASGMPPDAAMAREHYALIGALRSLEEPEFSVLVRKTLNGFALHWANVTG